tara:strand:+ start:30757 stop:31341 length:585 start_codon:yes stop_codon:yes gene_type:complete
MKATLFFIVEVEEDYNNTMKLSNGLEIAVNNSIDDVKHINRVGRVVDAPKGALVSKGDLLLFHHNICRQSWGLKGKKRKSNFHIAANQYYIPASEIFMMKRKDDSDWVAIDPFVFIEPLEAKMVKLSNGFEVEEDSYSGMKDLVGKIAYPNKELEHNGVERGDLVAFQQDSQHEYTIDGKLYYKMKTQDVLAVY